MKHKFTHIYRNRNTGEEKTFHILHNPRRGMSKDGTILRGKDFFIEWEFMGKVDTVYREVKVEYPHIKVFDTNRGLCRSTNTKIMTISEILSELDKENKELKEKIAELSGIIEKIKNDL